FWPLENQDDPSDPVSLATLLLLNKSCVKRLASQFSVQGEFDLNENEVLISENQAKQIEAAMNITVIPGTVLNLTVARQSVDFGVYLFQYQPINFYNITVRGIYNKISSITMLQKTFSEDFIDNSIIFLQESMAEEDIARMEDNGLTPILVAKCDSELLLADGINEVVPKLESLAELLTIEITTSLVTILDQPFYNIEQSYSKARTLLVVMAPVAILGVLLSLFTTNIVLEKRRLEIEIYQEKGGQKWQIIGAVLIEFSFLTILGILFAFFISTIFASLIPAIALNQLTRFGFATFYMNLSFPLWPILVTSAAVLVISLVFATLKVNQILVSDISDRDLRFKNKLQKGLVIGTLGLLTVGVLIAFLILLLKYRFETQGIYTYDINATKHSSWTFIVLSFAVILLATISAVGLFALLGVMKGFYNSLMRKNSFFLKNNLKQSRYKFSSIIIVAVILTSSTIFSLTVFSTINSTEDAYAAYNNGSDLRIQTYDVNYTYNSTIADIDGIEMVMPVLRTSGQFGSDTTTVYGIDPILYAEIGRWDKSSIDIDYLPEENKTDTISQWLKYLDADINGTIFSDGLAAKYTVAIDDNVIITTLPVGASYGNDHFNIKCILHSVPGLGLLAGVNLELNQPNDHFMLVNNRKLIEHYNIVNSNLFFAKVAPGADINEIKELLLELEMVVEVNPELISEGFGAKYINNYVPSTQIFLLIQIILTNMIGLLIIITNTDFVLSQRKQKLAILKAFGNADRNLLRMSITEILIVDSGSILVGLIIGIPFALMAAVFLEPFFLDHLIMPMQFSVSYVLMPIFLAIFIVLTIIGALPTFLKTRRENVAESIQDETKSAY
ncbi:MAG: FtsX-like permease family protein, partial [Candidatus Heimdallarchaeota archaeon]